MKTLNICLLTLIWGCQLQLPLAFQHASPIQSRPRRTTSCHDDHFRNTKASCTYPSASASASKTTTTSLQSAASPIVTLLSSPLGALGILATIILIHEAGHYLAARAFGIEVEEFAVGFGPKVAGFTAWGNEFNIRALPLGGYVRFPENYNATLVDELQKQAVADAEMKRQQSKLPPKTLGYRVANFLSLGSLERTNQKELEEQIESEREEYEQMQWWEKVQATQKREKELDVKEVEIPYDDNPNLLQNRNAFQRAVVISGGVIFNLLLSFFIYFGEIGGPVGLPSPVFEPGVKVGATPQTTAAANGLLRAGDVILSANGVPLTSSASPSPFEAQKGMNSLIEAIRATPDGADVELSVIRNEKGFAESVTIKPKRNIQTDVKAAAGPQTIGVLLTPNYVKNQNLKSDNPVEAAKLAYQYTKTLATETANGLITFLTQSISGSNSGGQVSGPIGLIREGSNVVATRDLQTVLLFAAAISINLGVVNAFPLPALDGGQLLFIIAEAVTRRKIDQRVQEGITGVAVLVLLLVSVEAAVGDIFNIFAR